MENSNLEGQLIDVMFRHPFASAIMFTSAIVVGNILGSWLRQTQKPIECFELLRNGDVSITTTKMCTNRPLFTMCSNFF